MKKVLTMLLCGLFALLALSACSEDETTGWLYATFQTNETIPETVYIRTDGGTELETTGKALVNGIELATGSYTLSAPSMTFETVGFQISSGKRTTVAWDHTRWNVFTEQ